MTFDNEEFISLLCEIMVIAIEGKLKVVPIHPKSFSLKPSLQRITPPGI
jgi:hypothetical protein